MMSREKQIEEMAKDICLASQQTNYKCNGMCEKQGSCAYCKVMAEALYKQGYRKQSEGEWKVKDRAGTSIGGFMVCSVCDVMIPTCDNDRYGLSFLDYCPRCGAKMKGGE